ncbi:hypothetical protein DMC64_38680 [Amycolatopsis sp. WAC 04197]|uniref:SDR family NAD(P)-dependent oxidoreductase n=1 Tax=Amycolatopsis sp. WAC 04197 TaxID=2203199 RepID=UPI000F780E22|nr:SDR family oxidoreductase [Amycolatopsis sp. WAC 04197]RSN39073.1 hypothetical protein DMC64_38680 [Amycolatopsis sp. WAC 04197]
MDLGLRDRTVLITGGSGGIGRELVRAFAAEGAQVAFTYHADDRSARTVEEETDGAVRSFRYAMNEPGAGVRLVGDVLNWGGPVQVLINNALSPMSPPDADIGKLERFPWRESLRDNIESAVELSGAVLEHMGEAKWGRFVHVSSSLVAQGKRGFEFYTTAKAALHGFSRSLAFSAGAMGEILSNVVVLGLTRTARNVREPWYPEYREEFAALSPFGDLVDAADVARMVVMLASAQNRVVTGQEVDLSGGVTW